jgi:hypothetical protein
MTRVSNGWHPAPQLTAKLPKKDYSPAFTEELYNCLFIGRLRQETYTQKEEYTQPKLTSKLLSDASTCIF